jgi:hypothetical protein
MTTELDKAVEQELDEMDSGSSFFSTKPLFPLKPVLDPGPTRSTAMNRMHPSLRKQIISAMLDAKRPDLANAISRAAAEPVTAMDPKFRSYMKPKEASDKIHAAAELILHNVMVTLSHLRTQTNIQVQDPEALNAKLLKLEEDASVVYEDLSDLAAAVKKEQGRFKEG